MGTISDKLMRIINTKEDIRKALISKGYDVPTSVPFKEYAKMILDLPCKVDSFPDIEGIVARYSASGLTNEQMAANPVWVDKTGNGHDLQLKNLAWAGMSGVGGYKYDFLSNDWSADVNQLSVVLSHKIVIINKRTSIQLVKLIRNELENTVNITLKITGLEANGSSFKIYDNVGSSHAQEYNKDGIYQINYTATEGASRIYFYVPGGNMGQLENPITIEQLPLYPGALVFDGVDDYGTCDNFPVMTKEKGYTVVVLRQWISTPTRCTALVSKLNISTDGSFVFEEYNNGWLCGSFGKYTEAITVNNNNPISWQTSKSYNGESINVGTSNDTDVLSLGKLYHSNNKGGFANIALYSLVILDHDATEEELTKIKDYFVKTYPWLFPDQAWTVVGKTNEDEDRATIANITGNGNDLVLSNFGFAEGSGYGLYKTPFELYPSVQHSSKYSLSFSKFALGDHNLIIAPKQNDLSYDIKVKVTGLKDGVKFKWGWIGTTGYIDITTDGIHMLNKPASQIRQLIVEFAEDFDPDHVVTIEQIPEYEGYLITDGVDDKVTSVNAVTLNKDFTVVGEWRFKETEIRSNCGIVVERVLFVYNIPTGIRIYIHEVGGNFTELQNIKSLKAICSNGIVYDENWNPISVKVGSLEEYSNKLLLGYLSNLFTQIAFKNMSIYSNQVLSKDDCIKAYNYLQTLKSK